jgi:hypothetical protein
MRMHKRLLTCSMARISVVVTSPSTKLVLWRSAHVAISAVVEAVAATAVETAVAVAVAGKSLNRDFKNPCTAGVFD